MMSASKPRILSLAPTARCELACACCYLHRPRHRLTRERDIDFFRAILHLASSAGFEEVAMSVNKFSNQADKNCLFLEELSSLAAQLGLSFSVTTNHENVTRFGGEIFRHCRLVSLSYDEFKFEDQSRLIDLLRAADILKDQGLTVNVNVLLSKRLIEEFGNGLLDLLLARADSVYLLLPKGYRADFSSDEFLQFVDWLFPLLTHFEIFSRVSLDNCIKPFLHPFSTVYTHCERGHDVVAVGPGGELAYSVFDDPYAVLQAPGDLPAVVGEMFSRHESLQTSDERDSQICARRGSCPFIRLANRRDSGRSRTGG
jgi:hypothetical protein